MIATLEVIQLEDGEIVLQRVEDSARVVTIRFSDEARKFVGDDELDIAKVMIQAGIQAAAQISEQRVNNDNNEDDADRVLH